MSSTPPTTDAPPTHRWRRRLIRCVFVAAVMITLLAAIYVEERLRGEGLWKRYQAEARGRGAKLTLSEYLPPPVAPERNFAEIPIFQEAFQKPQPPNPFGLRPGDSMQPTMPPMDSPGQDQSIDLAAWQNFFVSNGFLAAADGKPAGDILRALERFAPHIEQLRSAADRPESRFPVRYEDGVAAVLPHLGVIQAATRVVTLRMTAHLAMGDSAAAYEDFRLGLRLYRALEGEATLISGLVRVSGLSALENTVWGGMRRHEWSDDALAKIAADLGQIRLMDDYRQAMESERVLDNFLHDQLMDMKAKEVAALITMTSAFGHEPANFGLALALEAYPRGWLRLSQVRMNQYMEEMLARISQTPPRVFPDRAVPSMPPDLRNVGVIERTRYLIFFLMVPALSEIERNYAYNQTLLDQTRLGCALERHRLGHGSYPQALAELAPAFPGGLPADVMTGEPLHYRVDADGGCTLYAMGWNRQDDGGKLEPKKAAKDQPDWVWRLPAQK